jgi:hypothetical protein
VKGTQIQLTATAQGGLAPYAYRWTINGGLWIPWGTENTKLWDSSLAPAGTYVIEVWARSSDSTADAPEALATLTYVIGEPVVPAPGAPVIRELAR